MAYTLHISINNRVVAIKQPSIAIPASKLPRLQVILDINNFTDLKLFSTL